MTTQAREDMRTMRATVAPTPCVRTLAGFAALAIVALGLALPRVPADAAQSAIRTAPLAPSAATGQGLVTASACTPAPPDVAPVPAATCELWATTGSLVLPGATVNSWGFAESSTGPAQTPGPVLTVTSGQDVTLTVHNGLPDPLAMAVPGVRLSTAAATGPGEDTDGIAAGQQGSYTFTAPAPGTYLYEAGHTALGARQVAMGLVGAMIVRPAPPAALPDPPQAPTLDGTSATSFDDEAVLVLSEVDPAFNAAPRTFDLRRFHPSYRLINGHAYPSSDPIGTGHGRRTLVRYVNAGLLGHAMGVLGAKQEVLGISAYPDANRSGLVSDLIPAGQTEDVRITFPAGGADDLPLYETAGMLDNAGQVVSVGSRVVGFGGMLTFLRAGAVDPGTDTSGPPVTNVAISPTPVTPLAPANVTANASDASTGGSTIQAAEFIVDATGVAPGGGTPMSPADGAFDSVTEAVTGTLSTTALQALTQGKHTLYVRAQDSALNWGPASSSTFTVASTGPASNALSLSLNPTNMDSPVTLSATGDDTAIGGKVTAGEFFVDGQGTDGSGNSLTIAAPGTVASASATISVGGLAQPLQGSHPVVVHFLDDHGLWGPISTIDLKVDRTGPVLGTGGNQVTPNPTDGRTGDPVDPTSLKVHATLVDPVADGVSSPVVRAEGFLDDSSQPAGTGFVFVADDGSWNSTSEAGYGTIPLSQLTGLAQGTHLVYVHGRDAAGNWGGLAPISFVLNRGPTLTAGSPGTLSVLANPVTVATAVSVTSTVSVAEYFEGADPGPGNGSPLAVGTAGAVTLSPRGLSIGSHVLWVRAKDASGIWGKAVAVPITVSGLFADGFESGNANAWSARSGNFWQVNSVSATDGAFGLRVQGANNGTANSYLTQNISTATTTLHMAVKLRPNTLTTSANGTTVLQARSGNTQVLAVQYRNRAANPREVRLVAASGSNTTLTSGWVAIGSSATDLRVDWPTGASWPATGNGTVTLSANGTQIASLSVNRNNRTVSNIRLGVVSGSGLSGQLYLDSFAATN